MSGRSTWFQISNKVEYFANSSDYILEDLYSDLKEENFKEGEVICNAGDPINKIYFVAFGEIEIFIKTYKVEISIDTLYQGCSIGEYGILGDYWFMFTARAKSNSAKVYSILKSSVRSVIFSHKELKGDADRWAVPPSKSSELFLDFRMCRTDSKRSRIFKIVKLSVLRYMRIVKIFGLEFSFKTFDPTREIQSLVKTKTMYMNPSKHLKKIVETLLSITEENRQLKNLINTTTSNIESMEAKINELEKEVEKI